MLVRRTLLLVVLPALLLACASPPPAKPPAEPDAVTVRLDAVTRTAEARRDIHADTVRPAAHFSWDRVEVDYFGDAAVLLRQMAQGVGMQFAITGPAPHLPIFVQVSSKGERMDEVLRKMALQLGGRADIAVRDTVIELRYRPHR